MREEYIFGFIGELLKRQASGEKFISLAVGEPIYDTPAEIIEEAHRSMLAGETHYAPAQGIPSFREEAAGKVRRKNGISCSADDCIFIPAKTAIFAAFRALAGKRRKILLPDPGFFYSGPAAMAGLEVSTYGTVDGIRPDIDALCNSIGSDTAAVVLNDPSNPTGNVLSRDEMKTIFNACASAGARLVSDEAYEDLVYGGAHVSPGSFEDGPRTVISIFTLSKSYSMTGWRAGYMVAPRDIAAEVLAYLEKSVTSFPPFIQRAAGYALGRCDEKVRLFRDDLLRKRNLALRMLAGIDGMKCNDVKGAFYLFPEYAVNITSREFSRMLLDRKGVAVLPGRAFGAEGEHRVRISFSGRDEELKEGLRLLGEFMGELRN